MRYFFLIYSLIFFCFAHLNLNGNQSNIEIIYQTLDHLAIEAGTDKSSLYNHYTKIYAKVFHEMKNLPIKLLEIGIYKGHSVKMWEGFFPQGMLYFIDITDQHIEYWSQRSKYFFLDQANSTQLY